MSAEVDGGGPFFQVGKTNTLFHMNAPESTSVPNASFMDYAVSRDGQRILGIVPGEASGMRLNLTKNWTEELINK